MKPRTNSPTWPNGAKLAISLVVNFEEGAELSVHRGDETNEFIYEAVEEVRNAPDLCMQSHFSYGLNEGWPRIRAVLQDFGVRATINACGQAVSAAPWLAQEASSDGHEISAHGWRWETHVHMDEDTEREAIIKTVDAIRSAIDEPPVGWHTRSATSVNTRRLLSEHGGFLYDSNEYGSDTPYVAPDCDGLIVLPYSFDTNDMRFWNNGGFVFAEDFSRYCNAAVDRLLSENGTAPRMLSVGLHLRIIGRPARISGLENFLRHATSNPDIWFATRRELALAWREMSNE